MKKQAYLTFKEEDYRSFREQLLKEDGLERASFPFLGIREAKEEVELLVHKLLNPADADYQRQRITVVEPSPQFILKSFAEFAKSGVKGYLHAHSHPFSRKAYFSGVDDQYLIGEIRSLSDNFKLREIDLTPIFVRLVYGQEEDGFSAEVYDSDGNYLYPIRRIKVIGRDGIRWVDNSSKQKVLENPSFQGYLDRNIRWLGEEGQRKISETHLVICGLGGLGSFLIANARGLGFGKITLIDPDRVEESNLNRLVGASRADMGEFKVKVMAREIRKIDPRMQVCPLPIRVEESNAHNPIASGDIIVSAMDGMGPRMEVQILAAKYLKPLLDLGAGISLNHEKNKGMKEVTSMGGQLIFYLPGGPCLSCQGIIRPEEITSGLSAEIRKAVGYVQGTDITPSSVATINSVIVGMAIDLLVRYLTGFARVPLYISYDLLSHSITRFNFQKKPECPICGENGVEGKGDEETKLLEPPRTLNNMNSIPFFPFPLICI